jgi:hypothetical protein
MGEEGLGSSVAAQELDGGRFGSTSQCPFTLRVGALPAAVLCAPRAGTIRQRPPFIAASFSPCGVFVAVGTSRGLVARLKLDPPTAPSYRLLRKAGESISCMCWISRGEVVVGRVDGALESLQWSEAVDSDFATISTMNCAQAISPGATGSLLSLCFSHSHLVSCWATGVALWSGGGTGGWICDRILRPRVGGAQFAAAAISEDSIAILCDDNIILLWRRERRQGGEGSIISSNPKLLLVQNPEPQLRSLAIGPKGKTVAAGGDSMVYIWSLGDDLNESEALNAHAAVELPQGMSRAKKLAWLGESDGNLAILGEDGSLLACDLDSAHGTGRVILELHPDGGVASFAAGGGWLCCGSRNGDLGLRIYDLKDACDAHQLLRKAARNGRGMSSSLHIRGFLGATDSSPQYSEIIDEQDEEEPQPPPEPYSAEPRPQQLSSNKLRALLRSQGSFPGNHRLAAWRILLKLPYNHKAFAQLAQRGHHPSYIRLEDRYPIKSHILLNKLKLVCSALAHWSPLFGEVEFLPELAFPFVLVFGTDTIGAFETVMTILLRFGTNWLLTYPQPSLPVIMALRAQLRRHDARLSHHLERNGVDAQVYGWGLLRCAFAEVLDRRAWLTIWDHLFAAAERDPGFIMAAATAIPLSMSGSLLAANGTSKLRDFFRTGGGPSVELILKIMYTIRKGPKGQLSTKIGGDGDAAMESSAEAMLSNVKQSKFPLPQAEEYPDFQISTTYAQDFMINERRKVMEEQTKAEVSSKLRMVSSLASGIQLMCFIKMCNAFAPP